MSQGVYIHFPFCLSRCGYCSFVSYSGENLERIDDYLKAVEQEIKRRPPELPLQSVYLGGGTPSLMSVAQLEEILECLIREPDCEVSMEVNPGTLTKEKLMGFMKKGVNRFSLGVQSFIPNELKLLGRSHSVRQAHNVIRLMKQSGAENLSVDLIYGLPGQNPSDFRRSLMATLTYRPQHISLYALSLEEQCPLAIQIEKGCEKAIDTDLAAQSYEQACLILQENGYQQYEISNWALPGYQCRHNLMYWKQAIWEAYGLAAVAFDGNNRKTNRSDLAGYLSCWQENISSRESLEELTHAQLLSEGLILALRLNEGADLDYFSGKYEVNAAKRFAAAIEQSEQNGLLEIQGSVLKLTQRGKLLSNEVFWRFLPE